MTNLLLFTICSLKLWLVLLLARTPFIRFFVSSAKIPRLLLLAIILNLCCFRSLLICAFFLMRLLSISHSRSLVITTSAAIASPIVSVTSLIIVSAFSSSWLVVLSVIIVLLPLLIIRGSWLVWVVAHHFRLLALQYSLFSCLLHNDALFIFCGLGLLNEALHCLFVLLHERGKLVGQVNNIVRVEIASFEVFTVVWNVHST